MGDTLHVHDSRMMLAVAGHDAHREDTNGRSLTFTMMQSRGRARCGYTSSGAASATARHMTDTKAVAASVGGAASLSSFSVVAVLLLLERRAAAVLLLRAPWPPEDATAAVES